MVLLEKAEERVNEPVYLRQFQTVLCVDGCGALGDAKNHFLCADCTEERLIRRAAQTMHQEEQQKDSSSSRKSGIFGNRKDPTPVRRKKKGTSVLMKEFYDGERERSPDVIPSEIEEFAQQQKTRRVAVNQMRKYMIASNKLEDPDPKDWVKYFYNEPGKVVDFADPEHQTTLKEKAENLKTKKDEFLLKAVARMQ